MTVRKKKVTKKATKKKTSKKTPRDRTPVNKTKSKGRPTKYTPEACDIVIEKMREGYSKEAVAGFLDICKDTLYQWVKAHQDFADAIRKGEALSRIFFETKMLDHITHSKNGKQLNAQVFNLNMKNRFGWSDKKEINLGEETAKKFNFKLDQKPEELK